MSSELLILLNFLRHATLGGGSGSLVKASTTFLVSLPEILIIATPEIPGPVDKAISSPLFDTKSFTSDFFKTLESIKK